MKLQMDEALAKDQLVSELQLRQSQLDAEQLDIRHQIAQEQLGDPRRVDACADRGAAVARSIRRAPCCS